MIWQHVWMSETLTLMQSHFDNINIVLSDEHSEIHLLLIWNINIVHLVTHIYQQWTVMLIIIH